MTIAPTEFALLQGDDYVVHAGTAIEMSVSDYVGPSMADGAARLTLMLADEWRRADSTAALAIAGTVQETGSVLTLNFEFTAAQTAALVVPTPGVSGNYIYQLTLVNAAGERTTVYTGRATVSRQIA